MDFILKGSEKHVLKHSRRDNFTATSTSGTTVVFKDCLLT